MSEKTTVAELRLKIRMKSREVDTWREYLSAYTDEEIQVEDSRSYTYERMCWFRVKFNDVCLLLDRGASNDIRYVYHLSRRENFICDLMSFTLINPEQENNSILFSGLEMKQPYTREDTGYGVL